MFQSYRRGTRRAHPYDRPLPEPPKQYLYLWTWFLTLQRARAVTQAGPMPLTWSEIKSWSHLHRIRLKPWELDILTMLDDVWLEVVRKTVVSAEDLLPADDDADRKAQL